MKRVDITLKIINNDNLFFINLFKLKRKKIQISILNIINLYKNLINISHISIHLQLFVYKIINQKIVYNNVTINFHNTNNNISPVIVFYKSLSINNFSHLILALDQFY